MRFLPLQIGGYLHRIPEVAVLFVYVSDKPRVELPDVPSSDQSRFLGLLGGLLIIRVRGRKTL